MDFIYALGGFVILIIAGDALVRGAVALSLKLGISALVISLTIVAFGTSAPELLISVEAALKGSAGLALGNIVGSNIANILLVLGLPAFLFGLLSQETPPQKDYLYMILASVVFVAFGVMGPFTFLKGILLLTFLFFILFQTYLNTQNTQASPKDTTKDETEIEMRGWKIGAILLLGVIGLPLGAHWLIEGAVGIAKRVHIDEAIIGLTMVAIGTSLPELATTVMAAYRKKADVALGNVIGSNIFNLLGVIGITSLIIPLEVSREFIIYDFWVMMGAACILLPFIWFKVQLSRMAGALFLMAYAAYIWVLLT